MSKPKQRKQAQLIFEKWRSELQDRDRSKASISDNFDDLFFELSRACVEFDIAHELLQQAVAAHLPNKVTLRKTYKKSKYPGQSEQEFFEGWKAFIRDKATSVFYARYPIAEKEKEQKKSSLPGGMSREEYVRQQRYAASFPRLDLSKIPDIPGDDGEDVAFSMKDLEGLDE